VSIFPTLSWSLLSVFGTVSGFSTFFLSVSGFAGLILWSSPFANGTCKVSFFYSSPPFSPAFAESASHVTKPADLFWLAPLLGSLPPSPRPPLSDVPSSDRPHPPHLPPPSMLRWFFSPPSCLSPPPFFPFSPQFFNPSSTMYLMRLTEWQFGGFFLSLAIFLVS